MSRPLALIAAFLTLPACAADSGDPLEDIPVFEMETPLVPGSPVSHPTPALDNPRALASSGDLAFLGDSLFTVESGQPLQVAVYGPEVEAVARRFGGRGSGPGEFEAPLALNTAGGSVFVGDLGTGRISMFDPAGELIAEMPSRGSEILFFAVAQDGVVYIPVSEANHHLVRLTRDSEPEGEQDLFGERLVDHYRPGETTTLGRVAVDRSGRVHVYDSQLGVLLRFGPDGERQIAARLPADLDRELRGGPMGDAMQDGPSAGFRGDAQQPCGVSLRVHEQPEVSLRREEEQEGTIRCQLQLLEIG